MNEPLTEAELDEIAARAEAATPGPWEVDEGAEYAYDYVPNEDEPVLREVDVYRHVDGWTDRGDDWMILSPEDADFIAHARSDVPRLVAEVRRLRTLVEYGESEYSEAIAEAVRLRGRLPTLPGIDSRDTGEESEP